jgi:hypothetical protein
MKDRSSERIEMLSVNGSQTPSLFDLSKTGVCCFSKEKLDKGIFVGVKINELFLKAKVIYCQERTDGFRVGMQFVEVNNQQQKMLNELVDKFSKGVPLVCKLEK